MISVGYDVAMELEGTIHNGVAVPDGECSLPEGTRVKLVPADQSVWQALADFARQREKLALELPTDLAAQHDHYFHGTPKREVK